MKFTRLHLGLALTAAALLGIYWVVRAQDNTPVYPPPKIPLTGPGSKSKKKPPADPTLIIPPEVYEIPRPIGSGNPTTLDSLEGPELMPTGGQLPPPMFPPAPVVAGPTIPPPLPMIETKPPVAPIQPAPLPPPMFPPAPVVAGPTIPPPLPMIETKPPVAPIQPAPLPEPTKVLLADPPTREASPKAPEMSLPPPPVIPPPGGVVPPMKAGMGVAPVVKIQATEAPAFERVKSFVRIQQAGGAAPVEMTPGQPPINAGGPESIKAFLDASLAPLPNPSRAALMNLQTPAIAVEKRGPVSLRAGETQLYYLVIRNLGAIAAQQIRIEDEIPAGVRILSADPPPQMQGNRAIFLLPALARGSEQSLRLTLKADANVQVSCNTSVHVSAVGATTTCVNSAPGALSIRLSGPERVMVGKPAVFDIHVTNSTGQPLTGITFFGELPAGLAAQVTDELGRVREERQIEAKIDGVSIAPGDFKILKMPTTAVKPGRYTVQARVVTNTGEASATANIEVSAEMRFLQQAPATRLVPGRNGDLRIELANNTGKPMRNVMVADLLPEGLVFIDVSDGGLFQANTRTVHWLVDQLPVGATKTLVVRVNGVKTGQCQNIVSARADGVAEMRSAGLLMLEGFSDLGLRVIDRDNPIEVGRETVYEIQVQNPGSASASNVRLQVQFPPGLIPKSAQSNGRFSIERNTVAFEPIASLAPQDQAIFRVSALAQTAGQDQRVRFSVVSDENPTPRQREISVLIAGGN